jgi:hypothetical protein
MPRAAAILRAFLAALAERSQTRRHMMAGLFAVLLIAFVLGAFRLRRLAVSCLLVCLALGVGFFLWEIHSPEYGFRMPWLQVERQGGAAPWRSA